MLLKRNSSNPAEAEMLATTLRSIGDAVLTADLEANVTYMNHVAEMLTGWTSDDALGQKAWEVFHLEDETTRQPIPCPVGRVLNTGAATGYTNHSLVLGRDGSCRPVAYSATPLRDAEGEMQGVVLVFHCARMAATLRKTDERFRLISNATNDAVWDYDVNTGQLWWNDAITTLFGYGAGEIEGHCEWLFNRIHPDDRERVESNLRDAKGSDQRYWQDEYRFRNKDGAYSVVFERGHVMRDTEGAAVRMVGVLMDVTGRREAQEELLRMNAELELRVEERTKELREANRELESFTYSVSHDLRAPLRNILFSGAMLQEDQDGLDDDARATLSGLVRSAKRMSDLIDDLLQYSRLSRKKLDLKPVNLSEIATSVVGELSQRGACSGSITIEPGMRATGDTGLLTILYENLIDNACKFSSKVEKPEITVGSYEERGEQVFFVRDNGAGFDPALADKLFVPFERLHSDEEFPGTGIGLANVNRIVRRHGGKMWAQGDVGKGATTFFTL